jgi:hypothetical protein
MTLATALLAELQPTDLGAVRPEVWAAIAERLGVGAPSSGTVSQLSVANAAGLASCHPETVDGQSDQPRCRPARLVVNGGSRKRTSKPGCERQGHRPQLHR